MREPTRRLAAVLAAACLPGAALAAAPDGARQEALLHLLRQDCGACHGMTLKGGLGPSLLPGALAGKDAADLALVVLEGLPGTPMPPWKVELSPEEAAWLVDRLKAGVGP
ncbi:MAG: cytochrome c [Geminicoccaceae bacterium]|nr:cytochrome c [Geminicoccaceae bacterium]